MSSSPVGAAAEAIRDNIGGFNPANATQLDNFLLELPQLFEETAKALADLASRFESELPIHPSVAEHIKELAAVSGGAAEYAEEGYALHRTAHDRELDRIENPRPHEEVWDVASNQ
jgi:hypothetical protein